MNVVGYELGAEANYYVMIDTPNDMQSDLKYTAKSWWSDVKTIKQKI